jgi:beta-glucosidase
MNIKKILGELTLEEKAALCGGSDSLHLSGVERLGVPKIFVSDATHGIRRPVRDGDLTRLVVPSIVSVCFPTASSAACSFDRDLLHELGETLGNECLAEEVDILLGPGINIKRSPLCGRNFEYYSEDPLLAGVLASSYINGIQSRGVGVSVKHYAVNNQEKRRMTVDARIDERTLHEIYLRAFAIVVKKAKPRTIMCSYNKVNGEYASENRYLLTEVLREQFGFEGFVMSDWGAVNDRVKGLEAGLDLEMPHTNDYNTKRIIDAVNAGTLPVKTLDRSVERILRVIDKRVNGRASGTVYDRDADHEKARVFAEQCMVLLKNDENTLPLAKNKKIAFVGNFADNPRFQGGGSSHVNAYKVPTALEAAKKLAVEARFAAGYSGDEIDEALLVEAVKTARDADCVVVFAGLPDSYESEGRDRTHLNIPPSHARLIEEIANVQPNTVVVLSNGSPIEMPWLGKVKAVLLAGLAGEAQAEAAVNILFGEVNPSGKLAETYPLKLSDNPSYINFPGEGDVVHYREGIFVGYRHYDKTEREVLFPFGHGLSYTDFEYGNLTLDREELAKEEKLRVSLTVKNIGKLEGKEIVQVYAAPPNSGAVIRPVKELVDFAKVSLKAGETKTVVFELCRAGFACYNEEIHDWFVEGGDYTLLIGASSRDIRLEKTIHVAGDALPVKPITMNTPLADVFKNPAAAAIFRPVMFRTAGDDTKKKAMEAAMGTDASIMASMMESAPLRFMTQMSNQMTPEQLDGLIAMMNV